MGWDTAQDFSVHWFRCIGKAGTGQHMYDENHVEGTVFNVYSGYLVGIGSRVDSIFPPRIFVNTGGLTAACSQFGCIWHCES